MFMRLSFFPSVSEILDYFPTLLVLVLFPSVGTLRVCLTIVPKVARKPPVSQEIGRICVRNTKKEDRRPGYFRSDGLFEPCGQRLRKRRCQKEGFCASWSAWTSNRSRILSCWSNNSSKYRFFVMVTHIRSGLRLSLGDAGVDIFVDIFADIPVRISSLPICHHPSFSLTPI